jgi:hypothetical protein
MRWWNGFGGETSKNGSVASGGTGAARFERLEDLRAGVGSRPGHRRSVEGRDPQSLTPVPSPGGRGDKALYFASFIATVK